ncbi:hypothetical protein XBP1_260003 [Xenorhabdus bovienii str. puntauvense]|uniref:Uncharacterized protein n=1 Tax=Xenorhabdus bovienii str. puntauvense TaxID=1398201 RepID=A0A077NHM8_XENBV|nr:hypothetical protein XBFFR1_240008 [Xenorhabdus bovienii str. feltiae France]CDG93812.1 hypothetical protein XBFFL1_2710008 [Xenorhabdus bovienii str. feltiae Florida]CDG97390.1 hypothetical protein XBP1_260003 [Xenorhabdus bovienii str. puntauvense]
MLTILTKFVIHQRPIDVIKDRAKHLIKTNSITISYKNVKYTRRLSTCCFVGCVHSPQLHSYLCS